MIGIVEPGNAAAEVIMDTPIRIEVSPGGELSVTCYGSAGSSLQAVATRIRFTREASGELVGGLVGLVQRGLVTLGEEDAPGIQ